MSQGYEQHLGPDPREDADLLRILYGGDNVEPPACDDHDWEYTRDCKLRECQTCGVQEFDAGGFEPPGAGADPYGRPADPEFWRE